MFSQLSASLGDPAGPDPAVPLGNGIAGNHGAQQGAHWQVLILLFAASVLLGAAVLLFAVVQRTQLQARRRARRYGSASIPVAAPLLQLDRRKAVDVIKDDWRAVATHTAEFWADLRGKAPGWPAEAARQTARFQAVLQPHLARLTRSSRNGPSSPSSSADRATDEFFPDKVPTSALILPLRDDAHARRGRRARVSA